MGDTNTFFLDVAIIGGGPAGISACLELSKASKLKIALFEAEPELGGIPRNSHLLLWGLRDRKRIRTGEAYTRKLNSLIRKTSVEIHTEATVINITPGNPGEPHQLDIVTPQGLKVYKSRFLLLATGCFESPRASRLLSGTRPAGIFTTWTLMELVNRDHLKPGKRALIIGSEHVSLSCALTLKRAGTAITGMVEEDSEIHSYPFIAKAMSWLYHFPIYQGTSVKAILGHRRVEGVELVKQENNGESFRVDCDTVIITGKFRSYSPLIEGTSIEQDLSTFGPVIDANLMTSVPNIFAAGNILRGAEMHDLCALEGKRAAKNILKRIKSGEPSIDESISIQTECPIRYVVPQRIVPTQIQRQPLSWFSTGFAIQMEHTLRNAVIEAWSGNEKIWEGKFSRILAQYPVRLPLHKFHWNQLDKQKGITLKVKAMNPESV